MVDAIHAPAARDGGSYNESEAALRTSDTCRSYLVAWASCPCLLSITGKLPVLRKRHVRLDPIRIGLIDFGRFSHMAFALAALGREQVSPRSMLAHDFSRPGDLESFRDGLPGFAARDRFRHKARKIVAVATRDNRFSGPLPGALRIVAIPNKVAP